MTLGAQLRDLRIRRGLTQAELAEAVGLEQPQVSAIEVGRRHTTTAVLQAWLECCRGQMHITGLDDSDRGVLLGAVAQLDGPRLALLLRLAQVLPRVDPYVADTLTKSFEAVGR